LLVAFFCVMQKASQNIVLAALAGFLAYKAWQSYENRPLQNAELEAEVQLLHPEAQKTFRKFFRRVEAETPYKIRFWSGFRDYDRATRIMNNDPRVTSAIAYQNYHSFGFATDITLIHKETGEEVRMSSTLAKWEETGVPSIARELGLVWGGTFTSWGGPSNDSPHFDLRLYRAADLYAAALKEFGSVRAAIDNGNRVNTTQIQKLA
jgi:hypothetical protein